MLLSKSSSRLRKFQRMDIRVFTETLVVLLTVIRCQFAEEILFKFAIVGSRIDLYCESGNESGVDWVFKNQTRSSSYNIFIDNTIPQQFVARYSITVNSNQTTILSAEKVDSTYDGTYECIRGSDQRLSKFIRLVILTPSLCHSNDNLSAVGNTSHELYCSFSVARSNSSDDRWPIELCANGEQWHCQILGNFNDDPLDFGCSASAKLFTEQAHNENNTSLRINASHRCASIYPKNTATTTLSALLNFSDDDKQIIIIICAVAGGFTLLTIISVALLTKTRNCRKRKSRERTERTNSIHRNDSNRQSEDHQQEALYHTIEDSAAYAEIPLVRNERCVPSPYSIYNDKDYILKPANSPVDEGLYGEMQPQMDESLYSMCTA